MAKSSDLSLVQEIARRKSTGEPASPSGVDFYLIQEGQRYSMLSQDEEAALLNIVCKARDAKRKGPALSNAERLAVELLVMCNLRLVFSVIKSMSPPHSLWNDLAQEGVIGLLRAIRSFNPQHRCRFSTYAFYWVRLFVQRAYWAEMGSSARRRQIAVELASEWEKFAQTNKRLPSLSDEEEMRKKICPRFFPYHQVYIDTAEEERFWEEKLVDSGNVEEECSNTALRESIEKVLLALDSRSAFTVRAYFGIGIPQMKPQEIADVIGVPSAAVKRIVRDAINRLRHPRYSRILRAHWQ